MRPLVVRVLCCWLIIAVDAQGDSVRREKPSGNLFEIEFDGACIPTLNEDGTLIRHPICGLRGECTHMYKHTVESEKQLLPTEFTKVIFATVPRSGNSWYVPNAQFCVRD